MLNELIDRRVRVDSVTRKYVYSTEFLTYSRTDFFVACHAHERVFHWHAESYDATVYQTQSEAIAHFSETATRWGWDLRACYVKVVHTTETITLKHRNKVKGL